MNRPGNHSGRFTGKISGPKLGIAVLSALAVFYFVFGGLTRTSPGPLTTVHARIPELTGWRSCSQCHGGLLGDMTKSCLECHADIDAQLELRTGLHGALEGTLATRCASCHSEHHGANFQMVNRSSFALAGVAEIEDFDHRIVGFEMSGPHLTLACSTCHESADAGVLPEGTKRYLGLSRACATCHEDPHEGRMERSCVDCHSQRDFASLRAKGHERHLALTGGHTSASCRDCHAEGSAHALESKHGEARPASRTCTSCHESPHSEAFVLGNAPAASTDASCVLCHEADHSSFREGDIAVTASQHAHSGFRLDAPHGNVSCSGCHQDRSASFEQRHPGRAQDDCHACHDDPHGGQFARSAVATNGCRSCHDRDRFLPHTFTIDRHASTRLALTGKHLETACHTCHEADAGAPRRFHGTGARCDACHSDAHAGFFNAHVRELERNEAGTCASCHATESFRHLAAERFEHGRWTSFALSGAHAQESCETCHPRSNEPDSHGRTFGRSSDKFAMLESGAATCASCHEDPHDGSFDRADLPATVTGRVSCARCHTETSFRVLADDFDHERWTGFALSGRHEVLACTACHAPETATDTGRSWGVAKGRNCADCHDEPHMRQFEVRGKTDCATCHRETQSFVDLRFKHDIHSRFKLGDQHKALACTSCHRVERKGEVEFIRYKPMGRECSHCHENRARPFPRRKPRRR